MKRSKIFGIDADGTRSKDIARALRKLGITINIMRTTYERLSSYDDSEDFKRDVRLWFVPLKVGAQDLSCAAEKLERNGVGFPI
ncbi:hypothetical protein HID58_015071 [Brassica napus]|uniref:Uncharacterized protein n=1 Tax=Brassica napus TaxID=3708 RepID=A0ABQ8DJ07_BRANA|nr:hypothetical protein HID58_015071 [Brassica napus]